MAGVAGILLAAGSGTRMGAPKALLSWEGRLLVDHGVSLLREGGCDPLIVVLGAAAAEVQTRAALTGAEVVLADDWQAGMGASLARGLTAAEETDAAAALIALVDQPFVGVEALRRLIAAGGGVAVAEYDGKPRNPVLLARAHWPEIRATVAGTDEGARGWLRDNPRLVTRVDCTGTGSPADLDSPADLALLRVHARGSAH